MIINFGGFMKQYPRVVFFKLAFLKLIMKVDMINLIFELIIQHLKTYILMA
jgi:menaquinone-dependent protoporphyrinogen IX oxidase